MTDTEQKTRKRAGHDERIAALKAEIATLEAKKNARLRTRLARLRHDLGHVSEALGAAFPEPSQACQLLDKALARMPKPPEEQG